MLMIDRNVETLIPLSELLKIVARRHGIKRHWKTWYRWCDRNGKGGGTVNRITGERVFLEFQYFGATMHSSVEAFDRFWQKQNEGRE